MDNTNSYTSIFKEKQLQQEIQRTCKVVKISSGTTLLEEGAYVKVISMVLSGLIKVVRQEEEKEILLYYINPHESCIMSISSSFNNEKSLVKAVTEEDSEILLIPSGYINHWQSRYPSLNSFIINLYKTRFEEILAAFNAVAFHQMDDRLLQYLRTKTELLKTRELHLTHQSLADDLGTTRETVSRILKKFESEKRIALTRGKVKILDLD